MEGSDLARLLRQIDMENEAASLGLHGLASGCSQHEVITAKMERWGIMQEKLASIVGEETAMKIVLDVMEKEA
jgi:hypothetical protein